MEFNFSKDDRCAKCELVEGEFFLENKSEVAGQPKVMFVLSCNTLDTCYNKRIKLVSFFEELISKYGLNNYVMTSVIKCVWSKTKEKHASFCGNIFMHNQIAYHDPDIIIPVGAIPLKFFFKTNKIMGSRGKIFTIENKVNNKTYIYAPIVDPYSCIYLPSNKTMLERDLEKIHNHIYNKTEATQVKRYIHINPKDVTFNDNLKELTLKLQQNVTVSADLETIGLDGAALNAYDKASAIHSLQLCVEPHTAYFLLWSDVMTNHKLNRLVRAVFSSSKHRVIGQRFKFDMHFLKAKHNIDVNNYAGDTLISHYLVEEKQGTHDLDSMLWEYLPSEAGYKDEIAEFRDEGRINEAPLDKQIDYGCRDVDAVLQLYWILQKQVDKQKLDYLQKFSVKFNYALFQLENRGAKIAPEVVRKAITIFNAKIEKYSDAFKAFSKKAGCEVLNINSTKQVGKLIFETLGVPIIKTTDKGLPSLDKDVIAVLEGRYKWAKVYADIKKYSKLLSTYLNVFLHNKDENDLIHCEFKIAGTKTGRLCVSGETLLETSEGMVLIKDLVLENSIDCSILTHKGRYKKILNKFYKGKEQMHEVITEEKKRIVCTKGHRFYTFGKWKSLQDLREGDYVTTVEKNDQYTVTFKDEKIVSINPLGIEDVWDIEVEDDHSYVAQGFVNHNSAIRPALQTIPRAENISSDSPYNYIKKCFVSRFDNGKLIEFDFSQLELRIIAMVTKDHVFIDMIKSGIDIHLRTAQLIYNDNTIVKDDPRRNISKTVNFGLVYGQTAYGLANTLKINEREAQKFIDNYFETFPDYKRWMNDMRDLILKRGEVISLLGRKRRLPDAFSPEERIREQAVRQGINAVIQGLASDITGHSVIDINSYMKKEKMKSKVFLTVHDSILIDAVDEEVKRIIRICTHFMEKKRFPFFNVPLIVDYKVGANWAEAK